jgi:prepilin-type N-terminal cleavage/methylation domain-containing protein
MKKNMQGLSLIEMLLVLAIVSVLIYMGVGYYQQAFLAARINRTSIQMQQILNAGLAYYVANGKWPSMAELTDPKHAYLPTAVISPWIGASFLVASSGTSAMPNLFSVYIQIPSQRGAAAIAASIAGKLPLAYTTNVGGSGSSPPPPPTKPNPCTPTQACYVVTNVNIPGEDLNNAMAVNFIGLFHHGACVPVPVCPAYAPDGSQMTPEVFLVPVSLSGVNDTGNNQKVYPISSFTAYATGPDINPTQCTGSSSSDTPNCASSPVSGARATAYWRACVQIVTTAGNVATTRGADPDLWGQTATMAAFTRCSIQGEAAGSTSSVYSN